MEGERAWNGAWYLLVISFACIFSGRISGTTWGPLAAPPDEAAEAP